MCYMLLCVFGVCFAPMRVCHVRVHLPFKSQRALANSSSASSSSLQPLMMRNHWRPVCRQSDRHKHWLTWEKTEDRQTLKGSARCCCFVDFVVVYFLYISVKFLLPRVAHCEWTQQQWGEKDGWYVDLKHTVSWACEACWATATCH